MNKYKMVTVFILVLTFQGFTQDKREKQVHAFLDAWHHAAAIADEVTFFGSMTENAVYIGTDAHERWSRQQLQQWSQKAFARKSAWAFHPIERQVYFSADGSYGWFDERLSTWMGICRGSGVLKQTADGWKIEHYHLSVTVPNEIIKDFMSLVQNAPSTYQPVMHFDPKRDATEDILSAIIEASRTNKRILLDVGGNWCIWCRRLSAFIKEHKAIQQSLQKNYIMVKVNYSPENKNETALSKYPKIKGYPHIFVLDSNGVLLHSQDTAKLEHQSSYSEQKILKFLDKWAPNK